MTTNNAVNSPLSGTTGTGNFVGATSPTLITPTIGAATATSVTFSPTTGGIVGTTAADNAGSGKVGEFVSSQVLFGSAISLTTTVSANITSISLTAGDWDVWGSAGAVCATNALTAVSAGINTTSATLPDQSLQSFAQNITSPSTYVTESVPPQRVNVNTTTTVYLVENATSAGTITGFGYIAARRRR
jgi:hypothetical protein